MATTDTAEFRILAYRRNAPGADPVGEVDQTTILNATGGTLVDSFVLGAAASDQTLALPANTGILVVSKDYPFSVKLRSGETALAGLMMYLAAGNDGGTQIVGSGSMLLSGNGSNASRLEVWAVRVGT